MIKLSQDAICRRCQQYFVQGVWVGQSYSQDECLCADCEEKVEAIKEVFNQPLPLPPQVVEGKDERQLTMATNSFPGHDVKSKVAAEKKVEKIRSFCKRCNSVQPRYKSNGGCIQCQKNAHKIWQRKKRAARKEYIAAEVIKPTAGEKKKGAIIVKQLAKKNANDPALPRKACIRCKTVKSLDQFYLYTKSPDGHDRYCAACGREMKAESAKRLKEKKENRRQTNVDVVFIPRQPVMEDYLL